MVTFSEFLEKQNSGYDYLKSQTDVVKKDGIIRDEALDGAMCGFFVNLVHPREVAQKAVEFARQLSNITGSDPYKETDVYSTVASCRMSYSPADSKISPYTPGYLEILYAAIAVAVEEAVADLRGEAIVIDFDGYLYNQVASLAYGRPNEAFVVFFEKIIESVRRLHEVLLGVSLQPPRGATITLGRFTRDIPANELQEFFRLVETYPPLGKSVPVAVRVQYNNYPGNWNGHEINTYATIPLTRD